jgi:hypothetical protein
VDTQGPPIINVDALPVASKGAPPGPSALKGTGHLSITAAPGVCNLSVDSVEHGPTPLSSIAVPAGLHQIKCDLPNGKSKTAPVVVMEGSSTRYKFSTDD